MLLKQIQHKYGYITIQSYYDSLILPQLNFIRRISTDIHKNLSIRSFHITLHIKRALKVDQDTLTTQLILRSCGSFLLYHQTYHSACEFANTVLSAGNGRVTIGKF